MGKQKHELPDQKVFEKSEGKIIPAMYLGEDLSGIGARKIIQIFKTKKGEIIYFDHIKGCVFGQVYETYKSDKSHTIYKRPILVKQTWFATDEELEQYAARKIVVKQFRLMQRDALNIKKPHPDIVEAIRLLSKFTRHLDIFSSTRFFKYIENECSKKTKKR